MRTREKRKCPFCGKEMICVNAQDGEFTCTTCAEYANHDVLDFIEKLQAENERLKGELEMEHDDCSNAKKCEVEYHKAYEKEFDENVTLRKENAKLKCLTLLYKKEMNRFKTAFYGLSLKFNLSEFYETKFRNDFKAYRKAKAELKDI